MARTDRFAFSLIELLVVMAIVMLLIALLLPVLRQAKAAAQTAECLSRQRQFFIYIDQFREDKRWYPVNHTWHTTATGYPLMVYSPDGNVDAIFADQIQTYRGGGGPDPTQWSYYQNTIGDTRWFNDARKNFFLCPGMNYRPKVQDVNYIYGFSYISNGWKLENYIITAYFGYGNQSDPNYNPSYPWWSKKSDRLKYAPATLALLGEIRGISSSFMYGTSGLYYPNSGLVYITPHLGNTNLLCADGHAGTVTPEAMVAAHTGGAPFRFY